MPRLLAERGGDIEQAILLEVTVNERMRKNALLKDWLKRHKYGILFIVLLSIISATYILYLLQIDYPMYDHCQYYTIPMAIRGYWLLNDGAFGEFISGILGCSYNYAKHPNLVGYLMAAACYPFGLNESIMRCVSLLFFIILIIYVYLCASKLDSKKSGLLAVLIIATMPSVIYWSRMLNGLIFGAAFLMMAIYHLLQSNFFRKCGHSVLFGIFSGLLLICHRFGTVYVIPLWIIILIFYIKSQRETRYSARGLIWALALFCMTATAYIKIYLQGGKLTFGHPITPLTAYKIPYVFKNFFQTGAHYGHENFFLIAFMIGALVLGIIPRDKFKERDMTFLFSGAILIFWVMFIIDYCLHYGRFESKWYMPVAPVFAILIAVFINRLPRIIQAVFASVKCLLLFSLLIMIIPGQGRSNILSIFRAYYANNDFDYWYRDKPEYRGNGIIWSDMTYPREEEFSYFRRELSKVDGGVRLLDLVHGSRERFLANRLITNGVGREVNTSLDILACYLILEGCLYDDMDEKEKAKLVKGKDWLLFSLEDSPSGDIPDGLLRGKKMVLEGANKYFSKMNFSDFKLERCFRHTIGDRTVYKVVFKYTRSGVNLNDWWPACADREIKDWFYTDIYDPDKYFH